MDTEKIKTAKLNGFSAHQTLMMLSTLHQKGLNTIKIESNYQETPIRNIRRVYFNYVRVAQKQTMRKHNQTITYE